MQKSKFLVAFILVIWFVISFVTNILGPIMPIFKEKYDLSLTLASFLPFSFFLAYGIMSVPAGILVEKHGEKKAMLIAFSLNLVGTLSFAFFPAYLVALMSLFIIGIGMAMLQVIINPLMRTAGGEENFAFYSVMGQLVFGAASFISPFVFSYIVTNNNNANHWLASLTNGEQSWTILYWMFSIIFFVVILIISTIKMPKVELKDDEKSGSKDIYLTLLGNRTVVMFFFGITAYVGTEQALANWMSEFLKQYHDVNPEVEGAQVIAWFWGLMSIGCLFGLVLLKMIDSKVVLKSAALISIVIVSLALFGDTTIALYAFPLSGFCISVMFSIIFSLALNSFSSHHGSFSGILCSGIFGGALVPFIIGFIGDYIGLRYALMFLYLTLGYIWVVAYYAKPLIANKTIAFKDLFKTKNSQ